MQYKIAHGIHAEKADQIICVNHISFGFTHLAVSLQKPGMSKYLPGKRLAQRHQENRPVDRMETDDILADQMQIRRPQFLVLLRVLAIRLITDPGDIVGQRVQPYIDYMSVVEIYGNAPFKGSPGYAQILQTRQQEIIHHFILAGHRLDKFGVRIDMRNQLVRILAHLKEVRLLLGGFHLPAAVGAFSVHKLGLCPEGLAGGTVKPFIGPLIDIPLLVKLLKDLLHLFLVEIIGGADKFIVGGVQRITDSADFSRHLIYIGLGSNAGLLCL